MSAFCRICETGLSALPLKVRGAPRSAASRIADSAIATGAITVERAAPAAAAAIRQARARARRPRRQPVHRLQADQKRDRDHRIAIRICLQMHRQTHRPPGSIDAPEGFTGEGRAAPVQGPSSLSPQMRPSTGASGRSREFAAAVRFDDQRPSAGHEAFGVLVLSFAGHCSESGGSGCSLPVMRSTAMA